MDADQARLEAATRNLERVIGWINNADTKALIFLTFDGVLLGVLATNSNTLALALFHPRALIWQSVVIVLALGFVVSSMVSLSAILGALLPRTKPRPDPGGHGSLFFFGTIAGMEQEIFVNKAEGLTPPDIEAGLLQQVYVNSKIASTKHQLLQVALVAILVAIVLLAVSGAAVLISNSYSTLPIAMS